MSGDQGCLGLGCAGCLPAVGTVFLAGVFGLLAVYAAGFLLAVGLIVGIIFLVGGLIGFAIDRRRTTMHPPQETSRLLPAPAQQQPQFTTTKEYPIVGRDPITTIKNWGDDDIATLPETARVIVSDIQQTLKHAEADEEFHRLVALFPIGSRWVARARGSDLRVKILAVDHRWTGRKGDLETVIITFEHVGSGHRFHWPSASFANRWNPDVEEDF